MRVAEHVVSAVDSLQSISAKYLGDASRWQEIADLNKLDYPYLSADPHFKKDVSASGVIVLERPYTAIPLVVPSGTLFAVPASDINPSKTYRTTQDATFPIGISVAVADISCTSPGAWGNTSENTITTVVSNDSTMKTTFSRITNELALVNGRSLSIRVIGESLLIPLDGSWNGSDEYEDMQEYYARQYGSDMELGADGDIVFDVYGSVSNVSGIQNLAQAVRDRQLTPKMSLVYHPEYGHTHDQIVLKGASDYIAKMVALSIKETLSMDDRIASVSVVSVEKVNNRLKVLTEVFPVKGGKVAVPLDIPAPKFM